MSKRPAIDLAALTSEAAVPMAEAAQRSARAAVPELVTPAPTSAPTFAPLPAPFPAPSSVAVRKRRSSPVGATRPPAPTKTEDLQPLAFKVPPAFGKRFRQRAVNAELKLNELLFAALEAWEEKHQV